MYLAVSNAAGYASCDSAHDRWPIRARSLVSSASPLCDSPHLSGPYCKLFLQEHAAFEEGLRQFGTNWRKIQNLVPTRTLVQIRTHAQKYFLKHGA